MCLRDAYEYYSHAAIHSLYGELLFKCSRRPSCNAFYICVSPDEVTSFNINTLKIKQNAVDMRYCNKTDNVLRYSTYILSGRRFVRKIYCVHSSELLRVQRINSKIKIDISLCFSWKTFYLIQYFSVTILIKYVLAHCKEYIIIIIFI